MFNVVSNFSGQSCDMNEDTQKKNAKLTTVNMQLKNAIIHEKKQNYFKERFIVQVLW